MLLLLFKCSFPFLTAYTSVQYVLTLEVAVVSEKLTVKVVASPQTNFPAYVIVPMVGTCVDNGTATSCPSNTSSSEISSFITAICS